MSQKLAMQEVPGALALEVTDLTVAFEKQGRRVEVVSGVSFSIAAGRTLGVVGESGCGKTMTSLAVMGLTPAHGLVSGSIRLAGQEMVGAPERVWEDSRGARAAMVFQEPMSALNPVMTIGRQIAEVLVRHRRMRWREAHEHAVEALASVGIPSPGLRAKDYPHRLSGGMRQRAMIAIALACRPAVLVADEPTTALDVTIQAQVLDLMVEMQERLGMAIQFISHNLAVISEIADEIVVMYAGKVVEKAQADDLFNAPLHPYTRGLIETLPDPQRRVARLPVIPGAVPKLDVDFQGCRFAGRCRLADDHCRAVSPSLELHGAGHWVACHKVDV
ncbi:ABC transporter ATP-binding protein [Hydrogenophaga sp. PBL-H3]|uniref:ABC transporter ATP-binding protein n=1 Tax=Hydrogenophaga sp. PBL-H3 TaxID=434010 RepID=UPI00131F707A|nr:ABC transporter ATP-binding protein [Hydrogenophaga sp. PBL-H3]QHE74877.1 ABC transporter ATP-binding protein [Hydrogenophaga sp. PBL-H3]QHE79304.1 ABC transporter ATP-binding protein [Hydrogenophaga sp. PBL-H3]